MGVHRGHSAILLLVERGLPMSNHLPPGAIPKLRRVKINGQEIGNYQCTVKGERVNLRTKDYFKARERAKLAVESGVKDFPDDRYDPTLATAPVVTTPSDAPPATGGSWVDDVAASAGAGLKADQLVVQEKVYRPSNDGTSSWTQDTGDGATPPNYPNSDRPSPPTEEKKAVPETEGQTFIPPELLEGLVKQAAYMCVELQITAQEWMALRWGKFEAGQVPPDSKARTLPLAIWEAQWKKWIPTDVPLPEWLVAPILLGALTIPVQLAGAKPIKKEASPTEAK